MRSQIQEVMDDRNQGYKDAAHRTLFKSLLDSDLPPQEKTIDRLQDEGVTLVGAGQETVKGALTIATYYILQNPTVTKKLKEELLVAFPEPANPPELSKLEQLPYLGACIQEGNFPEAILELKSRFLLI
jgi:cytochrome P450